jgi:signal transduction histidine kinase
LDQLQYLSWLLYVVVFVAVLIRTIRRPTPAHVDMTLFFGAAALIIALTTATSMLHMALPAGLVNVVLGASAFSLGYLLLRLVADFTDVPTWLMRSVEVGVAVSIAAFAFGPTPLPPYMTLVLVAYLVVVIGYDTWAFARQASRSRGVTRRRMQAAAAGSLCIALVLFVSGLELVLPDLKAVWNELSAALGLASGVCYFVGFAPPTWLRRAWQDPEIRAFLTRYAGLTGVHDERAVLRELEHGAANALGAAGASIALWDPDTQRLRFDAVDPPTEHAVGAVPGDAGAPTHHGVVLLDPTVRPIARRAFIEQRPSLIGDAARVDPQNAALFEHYQARSILSAPITAHLQRLGVLFIYAPRSPMFANSDLELVQLLADLAAVILENQRLVADASRVAAREEAAQLKEDFLSSAAHDLKTPLTGLVMQAQLLDRKAQHDPHAPVDRVGLDRLLEQTLRLKDLVLQLLDVSRLERGELLAERENVDIVPLIRGAAKRDPASKRVQLKAEVPVIASIDTLRFEQVVSNLIGNALKYSPPTSPVFVRVWSEDGEARLSVQDQGIGIPREDRPLVFDRFYRARNVDARRFAGMGLGLYIARGIVESHGGRIWVESTPGEGSTFFVALPAPAGPELAPLAEVEGERRLASAS